MTTVSSFSVVFLASNISLWKQKPLTSQRKEKETSDIKQNELNAGSHLTQLEMRIQ
jgi:hypothetical protein